MNLKTFLPLEKFAFSSKLSATEIRERLQKNVAANYNFRTTWRRSGEAKPYQGNVTATTFTIHRMISHRNSFLPEINGRFYTSLGKTEVHVTMKPAAIVIAFMIVWMGAVSLICQGILAAGLWNVKRILHEGFSPMTLIPFGMFAFGVMLMNIGFKPESKTARQFLENLLEAQEPVEHSKS